MSATFLSQIGDHASFLSQATGQAIFVTSTPSPNTPLFSQLSPTLTAAPAGAYSLRALTATSVKAVRVRRSTDNAAQDFLADVTGNLTISGTGQTLASWLGAATGYVVTWYDQTSAGNDATQATAANQPIIQQSVRWPGYVVIFNGSSTFLTLTTAGNTLLNGTNFTVNLVTLRTVAVSSSNFVFGTNSPNGNFQRMGAGFNNDTTMVPLGNLTNSNGTQATIAAYNSTFEPMAYMTGVVLPTRAGYNKATLNGINSNTGTLQVPAGYTYSIGYGLDGAAWYYTGLVFELMLFTAAATQSDVTTLYNNQVGVYGA